MKRKRLSNTMNKPIALRCTPICIRLRDVSKIGLSSFLSVSG
ncbi:hypothetical protein [Prevotella bivia]|nr:hypothetical protein [Prevotella bivia]